jgi:thiol-disulfide isomerase/thioredoxin
VYNRSCLSRTTALISLAVTLILVAANSARPQTAAQKSSSPAAKPALPADPKLIDLDGYNRILVRYKGKPLLVTFWATWCEPCRDEFPLLVELSKEYAPKGLSTFGVSLDNDADMHLVRHFLALHHPGFPNYRQKMGIDVDAFYHGVNPEWTGTMPETIFYGRDGRIIAHFIGEQSREVFEQAIRDVLASPASTAGQ